MLERNGEAVLLCCTIKLELNGNEEDYLDQFIGLAELKGIGRS